MDEEQHVAQLDRPVAVVLRELVGVELGEGAGQTQLHLLGQRPAAVPPVDGQELGQFVRALDHPLDRGGDQRGARARPGQRGQQQQRRMTQVERLARLDRQRGHDLRRNLGRQRGDPVGDRFAVLVELVFPQEARRHGPAQALLGVEHGRGGALVGQRDPGVRPGLEQVETHVTPPSSDVALAALLRLPVSGKGRERRPSAGEPTSGGGVRTRGLLRPYHPKKALSFTTETWPEAGAYDLSCCVMQQEMPA